MTAHHPWWQTVFACRLIPVVTVDDSRFAAPVAAALVNGGLPVIEVTLRTPAALAAIRVMAGQEGMIVGAGTVLTVDQANQAVEAGARFVVSPGLSPDVVRHCQAQAIPVLPGVCTPSDIQDALALGLDTLKYFPAEAFGGPSTLAAVSAPFPSIRFVPTGGITARNVAAYLRLPQVIACGGSWVAERRLIALERFDIIQARAAEAMAIVQDSGEEAQ